MKRKFVLVYATQILLLASLLTLGTTHTHAQANRTVGLFDTLEWTVNNPTYTGNPFDVIATVTFRHSSGETIATQMYYAGSDTWAYRFTGTLLGEWSYTSTAADPELDGLTGSITVTNSTNTGFLTSVNNQFALQINETEVQGFLYNAYMNLGNLDPYPDNEIWIYQQQPAILTQYLNEVANQGFPVAFIPINNNWLDLGSLAHTDHTSENPDLETFALIESMLQQARARNLIVHIWAWGDEDRRWTPLGLDGGINGVVDQRLQRYIAARLGPLPGWTMGYGFDLEEWVTDAQTRVWANNLKNLMGWDHLLWARNHTNNQLDIVSNDIRPSTNFYQNARNLMDGANRPQLYERRFAHLRNGIWTQENTRRAMWQFAMAGGAGSFWGFFPDDPEPYPNPEQFRTFSRFWAGRFVLGMQAANAITDGVALRSADQIIVYKEDTNSIQLDLSGIAGPVEVIAVDTQRNYAEINIGPLENIAQVWQAPYASDWALAIGDFTDIAIIPPALPPRQPQPDAGDDPETEEEENSTAQTVSAAVAPQGDFVAELSKIGFQLSKEAGSAEEPEFQWIITASNIGNTTGTDIVIRDPIPASLDVLDVTSTSGSLNTAGNIITLTQDTLNPGESITLTVLTRSNGTSGSIENTAYMTVGNQSGQLIATAFPVNRLPLTGLSRWTQGAVGLMVLGSSILAVLASALMWRAWNGRWLPG